MAADRDQAGRAHFPGEAAALGQLADPPDLRGQLRLLDPELRGLEPLTLLLIGNGSMTGAVVHVDGGGRFA
ncbi:hypothetical protein [Amycolatopsis echigonensis]|uniref:Uncharacterized protein n=1 Tax=Amycolatopsis echigonensis TaxID=2576905 RepID=A0A8E2B9I2_9PSEU|nr:hypothetical protein [Amycolatopsis echigonensis]MBB2505442.1 hypothetical protein [Amycolatopsis echigonensis]